MAVTRPKVKAMVPMGIYSLIALGVLIVILLFIRFWPEKEPLLEPVAPQESTPPPNPIGTAATIGQRQLQQDLTGSALGDEGGLLLLADGRGQAGKIAAKLAIDTCLDLYQECPVMDKPQYYFRKAFQAANHKILSVLEDGRGSTCLAAAIIQRGQLFYALVGDSRIALFRDGDLVPVTEGQTIDILAQHRYQQGRISKEQALKLLHERRLYNFVGQDGFHDIEFFSKPIDLQPGDIVVILSDGVTETAPWRKIEDCLAANLTPQEKAGQIIALVEESKQEDKDNASVILYDTYNPAEMPIVKPQGRKKKRSTHFEKIKQRLSDSICL